MKKKALVFIFLSVVIAVFCAAFAGMGGGEASAQNEYLRVHIRANSNSAADQGVKYKVRDEVVSYLTPLVAVSNTKEEAMEIVGRNLEGIARTADGVLRENGYYYGARAKFKREEFPTRVYEGVTLEAGVYDALILELGTGEGDNWWCVVYPPLCFTSGNGNVVYKSLIADIIKKFFE